MKSQFRMIRLVVLVVGFAAASSLEAQTYERVLVPIAIASVPGAFGSVWTSQLWLYNSDAEGHHIDTRLICAIECPSLTLSSLESIELPFIARPGNAPGLLMFVQQPADRIRFNLRVQDLSRQSQTWGTEVPVIRERDLFTDRTQLLNVPLTSQFRDMLRVYDPDARSDGRVQVRAFNLHNGLTHGSIEVFLTAPSSDVDQRYRPSYAQIADLLATFPAAANQPTIGLEITPLTSGLRYWAFVRVTNDETQHVTTITPE